MYILHIVQSMLDLSTSSNTHFIMAETLFFFFHLSAKLSMQFLENHNSFLFISFHLEGWSFSITLANFFFFWTITSSSPSNMISFTSCLFFSILRRDPLSPTRAHLYVKWSHYLIQACLTLKRSPRWLWILNLLVSLLPQFWDYRCVLAVQAYTVPCILSF